MALTEATGRDHVDGHPKQGLQILTETYLVEERCLRTKVHEEVDVARGSGITSGDRAEHPHSRSATAARGR